MNNGAPVWLRGGNLETSALKSGKPATSMPLVQERLSPKTMKSMHHYKNFAIIEFSEDKAKKKWNVEARILAKPLGKDASIRLFN